MIKKGASGKAMLIDHKNFQSGYAPYLLNDIAAIKAYLDRQNDNKECNTASTILIGAGSGAALGSLWMGNESRRKRDKGNPLALVPTLGEPEVKDIAAAIWLSIAPRIGTSKGVGGKVASSLVEACVKNKVPVAFVFGSLDSASDTLSRNLEGRINGTGKTKGKDAALKVIKDTKLAGEKLLNRALPTEEWILSAVNKITDDRGARERIDRKSLSSRYYYVTPGRQVRLQKPAGEEVGPVDLRLLELGN